MCIGGLAIDKAHAGNGCLQMLRGMQPRVHCCTATMQMHHTIATLLGHVFDTSIELLTIAYVCSASHVLLHNREPQAWPA